MIGYGYISSCDVATNDHKRSLIFEEKELAK